VQLPPQDALEIANGSSVTILHSIWYNESESSWFHYVAFNNRLYPVSGVFDGVEVEYSRSCSNFICNQEPPTMLSLMAAGGTEARCETVRVKVSAENIMDMGEGAVTFHLFEADSFLRSMGIGTVTITILGMCISWI
jgi:hypothetical protein